MVNPIIDWGEENDEKEEEVLSKNGKMVWDKSIRIYLLLLILEEKEN